MNSEWRATDNRWWPLFTLLSVVLAGVPLVLEVVVEHQPLWTFLAVPAAAALGILRSARLRLRLTDAGVEVRRLRTRVYRWSEIASVQRAPEWDDTSVVWLRLRGSVPSSAAEVLSLPGVRARAGDGRALDDLVTQIQRRAGLEQRTAPAEAYEPV